MSSLFQDFPKVSTEQWEQAIEKLLKGKNYDDTLVWNTNEGFDIRPYYRKEDLPNTAYCNIHRTNNQWEIRENILVKDCSAANKEALNALMKGATSVSFDIQAETEINFIELVKDIDSEYAPVYIYIEHIDLDLAAQFKEWNKNTDGGVFIDPIGDTLSGRASISPDDNLDQLAVFIATGGKLSIKANHLKDASANFNQDLGYTLSILVECIEASNMDVNELLSNTEITFGISSNYFFEIAKLKSFTYMLKKLGDAYGKEIASFPEFSAISSTVNKTLFDPYVNMLRGTKEAMSAAIAGYENISILPFDTTYSDNNEFAGRIARNIQLILQEESFLNNVVDPSSGSYYLEHLTEQLIERAWELFLQTEKEGGFLRALEMGSVQSALKGEQDKMMDKVANGSTVLLGTNIHPNKEEMMGDKINKSDFKPVLDNQITKTFPPISKIRWSERLETERLANEKMNA